MARMSDYPLTVSVEEDLRQELKRIAALEHRSLSNLVRLALREFIEQYESPDGRKVA